MADVNVVQSALRAGGAAQLAQDRRPALAGGALDDRDVPAPGPRVGDEPFEERQLAVTLEDPGARGDGHRGCRP